MKTIIEAKGTNQAIRDLESAKQTFVNRRVANIYNVGLLTRGSVKNIIRKAREDGEEIDCYVTLCPFYDGKGGISGKYDSMNDTPMRYQQKFNAAVESVKFLQENIPLNVRYLLADQGILISSDYDTNNLKTEVEAVRKIYQDAVSVPVITFSEIGLRLPEASIIDREYTEQDALGVLEENKINPDTFRNQLQIIIKSFGYAGAYFFLKNYLTESQFIGANFRNALFVNTEACAPLNTIYTLGENRAIDTNCVATVNISL